MLLLNTFSDDISKKSIKDLVYVVIYKSPPEPTDIQWYASEVINTLFPEMKRAKDLPIKLQITEKYSDHSYIALNTMMLAAQDGVRIDLGKAVMRAFSDAHGGEGTIIRCYK